jgi:hypothetical protein
LYREAVDYVERRFDDIAIESLKNYASLNPSADNRLITAVVKRLTVMFHRRIVEPQTRREFDQIVTRVLANAPDDSWPPPSKGEQSPAVDWQFWLALFRQCLDELRLPFGLPGDIYQADGGGMVWEADGQQLGRGPEEA